MNVNSCYLRACMVFLFHVVALPAYSQIWSENFDTYANGTFNAPPKWTSVATDCDDGGNLNIGPGQSQWGVWDGQFTINDIEGAPCCAAAGGGGNENYWMSEVIDIEDYCDISISLEVSAMGSMECDSPGVPLYGCSNVSPPDNSHDQVVAEYRLDGGAYILFGYVCASNGLGTLSVSGLNGSTLEIRVSAANKANAEFYYFDNIVVNGTPAGVPTFNQIGPLCENAPPVVLPGTSIEGITGTWNVGSSFNPAGLGGTTTTITFTPGAGQCAVPATMDITVNTPLTPVPAMIGPYCTNDPPVPLPLNVGGISGNWSGPGVSGNVFSPALVSGNVTLTFTPAAGQCALPATLSVTVNQAVSPNLGSATLCQTDPLFNLTTIQDPNYPTGTWTGPGVVGNTFNPAGQNGNVLLTFTPTAPCALPATTQITVNIPAVPALLPATLCQNSGLLDLTTLQDPSYPTGTWSGPGVAGNNFNPAGQSGNVTLTFTASAPCTAPSTTIITVNVPAVPLLQTANVCQNSGPFNLTTLQDPLYPGGTWSGPGVTGSSFDPGGQNGTVILTYTPPPGCVQSATTSIFIEQPGTPILGTTAICQSAGPYNLTSLQDPAYPLGTWSGPGVTGNLFDPAGLSGIINLSFSPATSCAFPATTIITVDLPAIPQLGSTTLCQSSGPFDLSMLLDPGFPAGTWSGPGVNGNVFDPSAQQGVVVLTFQSDQECTLPAATTITVNVIQVPQLGTETLCETAGLFSLSNLADPNFPAGIWSGPGVTGNTFNPAGQNGNVTLTFTPSPNCTDPAQTFITVNLPVVPSLDTAAVCQNSGLFDLSVLLDPMYPTGNWSGPGVTNNLFNPAGQSGPVNVTFTSNEDCTLPSVTTISVNLAPNYSNQDESCDAATQTFTVSFDISGGTGPYSVDGSPVVGNSYISAPLPSGTNYTFELNDANGCGPVTISGIANCDCETDAGSMNFTGSPFHFCLGEDFSVVHQEDEMLDGNDVLQFVLHTGSGTQLGTVLVTSDSTGFTFPGNIVPGQTYYVSAIAGSDDGTGNVDLSDPCLSVSQGVPVSFYLPDVQISPGDTICEGECYTFSLQFSGIRPFSLDLQLNANGNGFNEQLISQTPSASFLVCPDDYGITGGTLEISAVSVADANCSMNFPAPAVQTLTVLEHATGLFNPVFCPGESVVINGTQYDENNPSGMEIFPNGSSLGCDSILTVDISYYPESTDTVKTVLCTGGSIIVNGTIYDENHPSGTEVIPAGSINGCDSIILIDLTFNSEVVSNLSPKLCPGGSLTINGTLYNASNSSGTETFPGGSYLGCDSTVLINLSFFPPASYNLTQTLCEGASLTVNGTVYNELNPTGTELLPGASFHGCDSIVFVNLNFNSVIIETWSPTVCPGSSFLINGTVYNENNPSGSETFPGGSYLGCDSTVVVDLQFLPPAEYFLVESFCSGSSLTVNGTVYDESNPIGTEVLPGAAILGCDSIIFVNLTFLSEVQETIEETLCPGDFLWVNGTQYNEGNPSGTETIPGGSYLGCDSVILVGLTFFPTEPGFVEETLCAGGSLTVNGTVYDESNPSGLEILPNAGFYGCDSMVFIDLSFDNEVVFDLQELLCPGGSIVVNGTVYDMANPTGTTLFPNGSYLGCDSIVQVSLSFYPESVSSLNLVLQPGENIIVNGNLYDQSNPSGTEIIPGGSYTGCDSTVFIQLVFEGELSVDFTVFSPACVLGSDGSIVIQEVTGGTFPIQVSLSNGVQVQVSSLPWSIENLAAGFYVLNIVDSNGATFSADIDLTDPPPLFMDLGTDRTLELGDNTVLTGQYGFQPVNYQWEPSDYLSCTDCPEPIVTPVENRIYTLTVADAAGCTVSDEIAVFVIKARSVYAPNAFSPNGDGINDAFTLFAGRDVVRIHELKIFDRWGGLVFEQYNFDPNDLSMGWDGMHQGQELDPAVFVWFAEVGFMDGESMVFKGDIVLIR